ncbi:uncharacterized protein B0I36DRAFT_290562 [Microdochium trichocladiopsis]|uniref:Uncharacterized protein n=1 Tax=Microdochium trichocladiopsis TaxID=1682393 RepID=A0A9P8Y4E3_9PEZI|nr:uncharacterized protein B0I36DRAFT_290562 [Microdochium trichocladiopsis]KAH7029150.1 hypothetical protein B0I36DRAFT_290562 [Microdochium trichocladiopsis]
MAAALARYASFTTSLLRRALWDSSMDSSTPARAAAAGAPESSPTALHLLGSHDTPAAAKAAPMPPILSPAETRVNLDWTRDPPPPSLTPFQRFFRGVDWAATDFGPMSSWPRDLRQMVRFMMAEASPTILYWSDTNSIMYNEAYVPLVGTKHPAMLGGRAFDVFPEFWSDFEKVIVEQRRHGQTASGDASMLLMQRHGFLEETYFNWTLVPFIGDGGYHIGCYGAPLDMTRDVIGKRRRECESQLAQQASRSTTMPELWDATVAAFGSNDMDVPFALLYSVDSQVGVSTSPSRPSYVCQLERAIGVAAPHPLAQEYVDVQDVAQGAFAAAMLEAIKTRTVQIFEPRDGQLQGLLHGVSWKGFGLPSCQFAAVPVFVHDNVFAVIVIGLNPRRRYNPFYREFLDTIADIIAPQIHRIRLSEEVSRRAELARRATLAFEKSEDRFSRFAERTIVGLATIDNEGKVVYANDALCRFAGMDPANAFKVQDIVTSEDLELLEEWIRLTLAQKKGGTFQIRSKQPFRQGSMHSEHRTAICACYPDLNDDGEVDGMMIFMMDISELKWTEEQLRTKTKALELSEGKYRNYAEHCPLGIVRTDGEGYVQFGNEAWHSYYSLEPGQELSDPQPWLPFIIDEDVEPCQEFFRKLQHHCGPEAVEFRLKDKPYMVSEGGETISNDAWVLATGFTAFKEDGTVDYIDFWVMDISAQKMTNKVLTEKMEEALRLKNQQERFMDMISHEIRNPLSAVLHCGEEVVEAMKNASAVLEASIPCELATPQWAMTRTALKLHIASAQEAANTVLYCVQHQKQIVDDVLTLSKLDSSLLEVAPIPVQPREFIQASLKIFERELKMTDISLVLIEDESLQHNAVDWILLDPNRYLQIVINLVTNAIKFTRKSDTRKITLTLAATRERPKPVQLGVEYVPHRYAEAPIDARRASNPEIILPEGAQNDIFLALSVTDTGKGMTESEMAMLFQRFAQASPKTHIEYGGSGLGLFISRQITEMLGGEIGMHSRPGLGSTFSFYVKAQSIPPQVVPSAKQEPTKRASFAISHAPDTGVMTPPQMKEPLHSPLLGTQSLDGLSRRVLVVEDNVINQRVLCKQLRNHNFLVKAANHGRQALETLMETSDSKSEHMFDIILCDIEMPIMGGLEFTMAVRSLETKGRLPGRVPIIGVTANVRQNQVVAALESGMDGVTTKPYRIFELIEHIERLVPVRSSLEKRLGENGDVVTEVLELDLQ